MKLADISAMCHTRVRKASLAMKLLRGFSTFSTPARNKVKEGFIHKNIHVTRWHITFMFEQKNPSVRLLLI